MGRTALTTIQANRLKELESVIATGVDTFLKVGRALIEIKQSGLYREKHDTFLEYVHTRWKITQGRAYQLMQSVKINDELAKSIDTTGLKQGHIAQVMRAPKEKHVRVVKDARRFAAQEHRTPTQGDFDRAVQPHLPADSRWSDLVARVRSKEILSALAEVAKLKKSPNRAAVALGRRAECISEELEELAELISENVDNLDPKVLAGR